MSRPRYITRASDLPESDLPVTLDGPHADESDYALVYSDELLAAAMAAHRAAEASQEQPDPDAARLIAEYAADKLAAELTADESVSAFLDASREQFVDWLSTMGSDPHAPRPGVVSVRPSTPAPAAAAQAVAS